MSRNIKDGSLERPLTCDQRLSCVDLCGGRGKDKGIDPMIAWCEYVCGGRRKRGRRVTSNE